ncbi:splicing factor 3a, subunit 3 [Volvox carteri f. nagariensis]|uniref:Splicing factor 3a, subunit 3 n=1 Tax=Volvox carteri f. nagariensis TaxID=3068 RepID=D8TLN4_VOLCA|nr:splicing factor 3a, subunit 3 [Volvox carteri f. nagariensis]EFJ51494.1 splicing factor 3a, subunit 3 [Volvox carteri f. nagariensis]|eukprot:XP_002947446.1 splicing factor 3a, subunit 3 [Volvox carteri f. nagariensis]
MAETLLEQTRSLHEDVERFERIIVKDLKQETKSHKDKIMQSHRVRKRLDQIQDAARKLLKIYEDEDKARKEEIEALGGEDKIFSKFYDRLKEIREYHRKFLSNDLTEAEDDTLLLKEEPHVDFTGEEGLGRYLDMHDLYLRFLNLQSLQQRSKGEYYEYLTSFSDFSAMPRQQKMGKQYSEYLAALLGYLCSFYERTQPLAQLQRMLNTVEKDFSARWEQGQIAGWEDRGVGNVAPSTSGIELEAFSSAEELEILGADRLKEALTSLGLKCGGTTKERAARLWLTRDTPLSQLDRKHFAKGVVPPSDSDVATNSKAAHARHVALLEVEIRKMAELLVNVIADTKGKVEKKQAQTYEEMQAELAEAEAEVAAPEDDEEDEFVYNPLKLPLGWDGKPIPYWLYKLHGLNQEFKCEICGNYSYWGRRAYEKHFKEYRHLNGMRALGIPNNKMFYEVTKIEDALQLWKSIQKAKGDFKPEDEEFEDAQGNVYSKKTYDDLKRQGLI